MKFQATSAVLSIALYSMKIGGVDGKITVNNQASALDMVTEIVGDGFMHLIKRDTIKLIGDSHCSGVFSKGKDAMKRNDKYDYKKGHGLYLKSQEERFKNIEIGFPDKGIVLSSGRVDKLDTNVEVNKDSSTSYNTKGDEYLNKLVKEKTNTTKKTVDACILEFNFTSPDDATMSLEYLFGSDEYNRYAEDKYHDVFALVLNGQNIATVPGVVKKKNEDESSYEMLWGDYFQDLTYDEFEKYMIEPNTTRVAIDTVNMGRDGVNRKGPNSNLFVNNCFTRDYNFSAYMDFAPNGFTTMLEALGKVKKGSNNKISFRIADVTDTQYDSWVMITNKTLTLKKDRPRTLRPSSSPTKSPTPYVKGDPHFMTWAGELFDFHGVCDLVLVRDMTFGKGIGMDIHVRSKKMKMWSFVSSAVVRIGQDIFEVTGETDAKFLTNGVKGKSKSTNDGTSLVSTVSGFPIYRICNIGKGDLFAINLGNDEKIMISTWHLFVSVSFKNASREIFKDSVGLLGSFPGGLKLARDGTTIIKEPNEHGQEWQVRDSEPQLFHNIEGPQYPSKCVIPSTTEMRRRLGESKLTMNEAKEACVNVEEAEMNLCIFDVLATNDEFTAGAY